MANNIFFVSDTHFNHTNILSFLGEDGEPFRKFSDVNEMNETMIHNWNSVVRPQDKVYHLGDVYFGNQKDANHVLSRLNGHKRLIVGNHDNLKDTVLDKWFEKIMLWRIFKDHDFVATHVPVHQKSLRKVNYNVHGHIHEKKSYSEIYKNISVEQINYTPIHIDEIKRLKTHGES